jgi:hypothetical protein
VSNPVSDNTQRIGRCHHRCTPCIGRRERYTICRVSTDRKVSNAQRFKACSDEKRGVMSIVLLTSTLQAPQSEGSARSTQPPLQYWSQKDEHWQIPAEQTAPGPHCVGSALSAKLVSLLSQVVQRTTLPHVPQLLPSEDLSVQVLPHWSGFTSEH